MDSSHTAICWPETVGSDCWAFLPNWFLFDNWDSFLWQDVRFFPSCNRWVNLLHLKCLNRCRNQPANKCHQTQGNGFAIITYNNGIEISVLHLWLIHNLFISFFDYPTVCTFLYFLFSTYIPYSFFILVLFTYKVLFHDIFEFIFVI